jgi:tRNA(fMet)-specific endonuclease VapC
LSYRFDTDHITILPRQAGLEFAAIMAHMALHAPSELAFSMISLHEQP